MLKVIVSHENLDFDGLASMVAASKIYPQSTMVFSGKINEAVRAFHSLYKNILYIRQAAEIDVNKVTELIIVDTNSFNRLGKFKALKDHNIAIRIYDHHLETEDTIQNCRKKIKAYGSCTAILVEEIIAKKITMNAFEATLLLIGIYTDTNCLTFSSTTSKDAEAVAYLLEQGADLEVVNEYIQKSLSDEHHQLFLSLLLNMQNIEINNYKIILSTYICEDYVGELSYMANKMLEIKDCDAVFLIVEMEKRYYIVGRSLHDEINMPFILAIFKGRGHIRAASATVKSGVLEDIEKVKEILLENLYSKIKPQITARDIMNYPVKTIDPSMTIEEVSKIMLRYGHTGMPVVKDDELIGIISRTDIDKAMIHGLTHAPVKGFMKSDVKTISAEASLNEISDLLVSNNIGRLPVVEKGRMIGIVTRTDLLRRLYGENHPSWYRKNFQSPKEIVNCQDKIAKLSPKIYEILRLIGETGDVLSKNVYIVGGFVRDLLLNTDNFDLDIVIEGDGILFAKELNKKLQGELITHEQFGTASIKLQDHTILDIVSARREYYEYPAALPKVEKSSLWNDLFRRDFTLNCMAIQINKESFGKLIDYFGGLEDIYNKKIRVLYNLSFVEDPTRIFRAIRFAARLDFEIEAETKSFIMEAVKNNSIKMVSDDRIREEITCILNDKHLNKSIVLMRELGIFNTIDLNLNISDAVLNKISYIGETIADLNKYHQASIDKETIVIMQLLRDFPIERLHEVINKFIGNKSAIEKAVLTLEDRENIYDLLKQEELDRLTLYRGLHKHSLEGLMFLFNDCENPYIKHYIRYYMLHLMHSKIYLTGEDLLQLGIAPGPIYGEIFRRVLEVKILGEIYDRKDELNYAEALYEELKGRYDV